MRLEFKWSLPAVLLVIFGVSGVESRTCTRTICTTERRRVCAYRTWQGCCAYKWVYKPVVRTERYCCSGYTGSDCRQPICNPSCQNGGTCSSPGVCRCTAGREGPACTGIAPCSVLSPCYPGICNRDCLCQDGFTDNTCLRLQDNAPDVYQTRVRLASLKVAPGSPMDGMLMYELNAESANPGQEFVDEIWSNQEGFSQIEINGVAQFDPTDLYPKPIYVNKAEFGVTSAVAEIKHTKHDSGSGSRRVANTKNRNCREVEDKDLASYWNCTAIDDKFDTRIDNADELEVTFTFKSGGYRQLANWKKENYTEQQTVRKLKFKFDLEVPTHCVSSSRSCSKPPLRVHEEITRNPVAISWDGWSDSLSGMYRFAWEIFRLEPITADGELGEKLPLKPLINNAWFTSNGTLPVPYTPREPGMYSVILEASDLANNSRYARRLFLYDNVSSINVSGNNNTRLFVSSAADNTGNQWQADLTNDIVVEWTGHFVNRIHRDNKLLNAVQKYPAQFTDIRGDGRFTQKSIDFDDNEGRRTLEAIPNANGIVKFEVAYDKDNQGGRTLNTPASWKENGPSEKYVIRGENPRRGETVRVWVRATDIMGNSEIDTTLVSFDDTEPHFNLNPLQKNIIGGKYPYSSIVTARAFDNESGIWGVTWQITPNSTGTVKMTGQVDLTPFQITRSGCNSQAKEECYCTPANKCYLKKLEIELNHCWFVVPKERLGSEVITMAINVTNPAMLTTTQTLKIDDLPSFNGIGHYSPPTNVRVIRGGFNTVRISWDNTPSCYVISELWVNYTGDPVKRKIHRNSSFYDITGLIPKTNYTAHLITGYDGEMSDPVEFVFRTGPAPEYAGLTSGAKAGIGIGVLLFFIIIIVAMILLWHFGIIAVVLNKKKDAPMTKAAVKFSRMSRKVRGAAVDDDIYVYGGDNFDIPIGVQIAASRLTLEELIAEGKFARVYQASLTTGEEKKTVAAKMVKESLDPDDRQLMKGKILFYLNEVGEHRNILRMIGTVLENEDWGPVMVMEYCEMGPMRTWLVKQKGAVTDDVIERMFHFAYGIVQGMAYLAQVGIVHRRLAARNILLTFLLEVRIGGFGPTNMTEGLEEDEKVESRKERIPLRWVAPECVKSFKNASEKSDVWSFGIVLWEIFSLGDNPYPTLKTHEIPMKVKGGHRMSRPEFADDLNYDMMQRCWELEAKRRPKFRELEKSYEKLMTGGSNANYNDNYSNYTR